MLNLTRDDKEVDLLLNGGGKNTPHPSVPLRIQQAIDVGFKEVRLRLKIKLGPRVFVVE